MGGSLCRSSPVLFPTYGIPCIEASQAYPVKLYVPSSTDARIDRLCAKIRALCSEPYTSEAETELRTLARELRIVIQQHVRMATSSLGAKKTAIIERDPDEV